MLEEDAKGIKPLYRNRAEIEYDKSIRKSKGPWWNKGETKYKAVLFVPATPGSELAKRIRAREAQINSDPNERLKIVEKGGVKIRQILAKNDPFPQKPCDEVSCPLCQKSKFLTKIPKFKVPCDTQSVGYRWTCSNCNHIYEGETGRTIRTRTKEHVTQLKKSEKSNPLVKHYDRYHPELSPAFQLEVLKSFKDPLSRQAEEGVRIYSANPERLMNTKNEFNHPSIKRLGLITSNRHFQNSAKSGRSPVSLKRGQDPETIVT